MKRQPFCERCKSKHPAGDCPTHPRVTFTPVKTQKAFDRCVSQDNTIRIRVLNRKGLILADSDFWHLPYSLKPEATQRIFDTCNRLDVQGIRSVGGGRTSLRILAQPSAWNAIRHQIAAILADPQSWLRVPAHGQFPKNSFETFTGEESAWDYSKLLPKKQLTESQIARAGLRPDRRMKLGIARPTAFALLG